MRYVSALLVSVCSRRWSGDWKDFPHVSQVKLFEDGDWTWPFSGLWTASWCCSSSISDINLQLQDEQEKPTGRWVHIMWFCSSTSVLNANSHKLHGRLWISVWVDLCRSGVDLWPLLLVILMLLIGEDICWSTCSILVSNITMRSP